MCGSNYCFLSWIQVSQVIGTVVWYSHLFKIYTVYLFFWNSLAFFMIQQILAIWSLVPLPLWNPACAPGSSQFTCCWSLARRILSITLLACEMSVIVQMFEHSLALPFVGIVIKTDIFQSCGNCWVFQICWHIEYNTLTVSSFRIWNSLTGILSSPLVFCFCFW